MKLGIVIAALAAVAVASPALAMRHADVVYFQQFKLRQKMLAEAAKTTPAAPQQVASAPLAPPPLAAPSQAVSVSLSR